MLRKAHTTCFLLAPALILGTNENVPVQGDRMQSQVQSRAEGSIAGGSVVDAHQTLYDAASSDGVLQLYRRGGDGDGTRRTRDGRTAYTPQPPQISFNLRHLDWWEITLLALLGIGALYLALDLAAACYAYRRPESILFGRRRRPFTMSVCPRIFRPEVILRREEERRVQQREKHRQLLAKLDVESDTELAVDWGKKETKLRRCCNSIQGSIGLKEMRMFKLIFFAFNITMFLVGMFTNFYGPESSNDSLWWYSWGYPIAKAFGFMLDFEFAFIVLPTMEIIQTMFRSVGTTRQWLPVDDPIGVHMLTAWYIAVASVGHIVGHAVNIHYMLPVAEVEEGASKVLGLDPTFVADAENVLAMFFDTSVRCAPFTGVLLSLQMIGIYLTALPGVRRGTWSWAKRCGGYKLFWRLHKSWPALFLLLLIHSPQRLWIWLFFPAMLLAIDRVLGSSVNKYYAALKKAKQLPHDVLSLTFELPEGFRYTAGQYIYLQWGREWHPFTLTSAPEEEHLSVHIRSSKDLDWCSALRRRLLEEAPRELWRQAGDAPKAGSVVHYQKASSPLFNKFYSVPGRVGQEEGGYVGAVLKGKEEALEAVVVDKRALLAGGTLDRMPDFKLPAEAVPLKIHGPHGAPAQKVWQFDVIMLVGSGIGITPFISILRSTQIKAQQRQAIIDKAPRDVNLKILDRTIHIPKKIHFYWIVRNQEEFDWFLELLTAAVQGPAQGIIDIKLFATKEVEPSRTSGIKCHFEKFTGRPNWNKIFTDVEEQSHGQHIGVFLCGNPAIGQELEKMCELHTDILVSDGAPTSDARGTEFSFFSEHF